VGKSATCQDETARVTSNVLALDTDRSVYCTMGRHHRTRIAAATSATDNYSPEAKRRPCTSGAIVRITDLKR
jgi:hypothetical protein